LAFSTVVSLLFLPTIYAVLDDMRAHASDTVAKAMARRRRPASPEAASVTAVSSSLID
jgi:HAE1 family hydrophobic/amphiphilic exporter-1